MSHMEWKRLNAVRKLLICILGRKTQALEREILIRTEFERSQRGYSCEIPLIIDQLPNNI